MVGELSKIRRCLTRLPEQETIPYSVVVIILPSHERWQAETPVQFRVWEFLFLRGSCHSLRAGICEATYSTYSMYIDRFASGPPFFFSFPMGDAGAKEESPGKSAQEFVLLKDMALALIGNEQQTGRQHQGSPPLGCNVQVCL